MNSSSNLSCPSAGYESPSLKAMKTAAYMTFWILSFSGNLLLVVVVYRNRRVQTTLNILIANIAIADILLTIFGIPQQVLYIYKDAELGPVIPFIMCKFTPFTNGLSTSVSMMSLVVIAIERFQAIVYPMKFKVIRIKRGLAIIAVCWLIGIIFSSCNLLTFRLETLPGNKYFCNYTWEPFASKNEGHKNYTISYFVCFIAIPLTLMIVLYTALIHSLRRHNSIVNQLPAERKRRARENRNVICMLVTMVVVFVLSWSPYFVINIFLFIFYWNFKPPCYIVRVSFFAVLLSYLYTILHPLIYYCFSRNYREKFQQLLLCQKPSHNGTEFNMGIS